MHSHSRFASYVILIAVLLAILLTSTAMAQSDRVYQWTDPNGVVVFSDEPPDGASTRPLRTIEVQPVTVVPAYQPAQIEKANEQPVEQPAHRRAPYQSFTLTQPEDNEAIRKNSGDILVESRVEPGLYPGDVIRVYLDGKSVAEKAGTSFDLPNVDRGTHTLEARIYDDRGQALAASQPVRFTVIRNSLLHNSPGDATVQPRVKITNPILYGD